MTWVATGISSFLVGGPISSSWRGGVVFQYRVFGSPAVCCWWEPIIWRILGRNRWPTVLRLNYHDNSPWALHWAGGRSRSLDGGRNRYSYGTVGTSVGFGGEIAWLKHPQSRLKILWWCPLCNPEAASEVKVQAESKFHMYGHTPKFWILECD
jgi:hypothetical protein